MRLRLLGRWFAGLALAVALPKCFLCVAAWLGLGSLLGLGQPELCGAPPPTISDSRLITEPVRLPVLADR